MQSVKCVKCRSESVYIEQLTAYRSTGLGVLIHDDDYYVAENNELSLLTTAFESNFVCKSCSHKWDIDKKIFWEWTGD